MHSSWARNDGKYYNVGGANWQGFGDVNHPSEFRGGGVVALSVEYRTCDPEVVGLSLGRARGVETLGKFLKPVCFCSPRTGVQVGTGQRAVMPCSWGVKAGVVCVWVAGKTV